MRYEEIPEMITSVMSGDPQEMFRTTLQIHAKQAIERKWDTNEKVGRSRMTMEEIEGEINGIQSEPE